MKIIIAGSGEVGSHLAKLLSREEQDIILIDRDADKLARIDSNYNLMTLTGSPTSFKTLNEARVGKCDLFIAVTPYENENIVSCGMAKTLGAKKTVARIDNYEFLSEKSREFFANSGVDHLIYPEYLAAQEIVTALRRPWVRNWFELHNGELILIGVKVRENAELIGKQLKQLTSVSHDFHVSAIKRGHETIIPRGDDTIKVNDILYFVTKSEHVDLIRRICGKRDFKIRNVMIMSGSRIAVRLVNMAQNEWRFTIIDPDMERCQALASKCPDCEIVNGDARNVDVLVEEGIGEAEAFVALSDSPETNILACLTAKELGVPKTVAEVENIQFISQAEGLNIGTIINKKLLASSKIFQLLLAADDATSKFLALADAEVCEIEAHKGSKITKAPVRELRLFREMTIAGLIRDGHGMLVDGNTVIQPGDHVLVFSLSGVIHKIEKLFI